MGRLKGQRRQISVPITSIDVIVDIDEESGFDGTIADLEEIVTQSVIDDIESGMGIAIVTDGLGWVVSDCVVRRM